MKDEPSSPTSNPENGEKYPGTGGEELREDFYDWETELNDKMLKMLNEVYPENHKFDLNTGETLEINLNAFDKKYKLDTSDFNNENVKCDVYKSKVIVSNDSEYGIMRGAQVVCEKLK